MCEPISTTLAVASAATKAASSIFGGISARNAANANARLSDQNAEHANRQAADAIARGSDETARRYLQAGQLMGRQTAAMAANGIELGFGSPLDVIGSTALTSEIDAATLRENARREAETYRMQALNFRQGAENARAQGRSAMLSGVLDAAGTMLGTASQVAGMGGPKPKVTLTHRWLDRPLDLSTTLPTFKLGG